MSVWHAWEVREDDRATAWFQVRLAFADGATVDALAVAAAGSVRIEDVQARPALSLADLAVLAEWIEGPLFEACGVAGESCGEPGPNEVCEAYDAICDPCEAYGYDAVRDAQEAYDGICEPYSGACEPYSGACEPSAGACESYDDPVGARRARSAWPRGIEGRRLVAQEYRAAQAEGVDPVLAVMCATGRSRRRSLRLIAQARDAGFLTPRHARR
ncbi:hypothetical protein I2W78_36805 [Streptomyces spinoverrucosus]|nr:hypothetical protein [Streptomyces spinoverrucosus]